MKKLLFSFVMLFTFTVSACWFMEEGSAEPYWEMIYISSVNWKHFHLTNTSSGKATVENGQSVDLPISVQIKIADLSVIKQYTETNYAGDTRFLGYKIDEPSSLIMCAQLYYRIERNGSVVKKDTLVKTLVNENYAQETSKSGSKINWLIDFSSPVELFGVGGIIDIPESQIKKGDEIIIYIALESDLFKNYTTLADSFPTPNFTTMTIDSPEHQLNKMIEGSLTGSGYSYTILHVFKVVYSGNKRLII